MVKSPHIRLSHEFIFSLSCTHTSYPFSSMMAKTNLIKSSGLELPNRGNVGLENKGSMCDDATRSDAALDRIERNEQPSPKSSFEGSKTNPSSTNTTDPVAPSPPVSAWLSSTQLPDFYYRTLSLLLLLFLIWRSLSFSLSIQTVSSPTQINNTNGESLSTFHCNPWLCYSASLSIGTLNDTLPSVSPRRTRLASAFLKECLKGNQRTYWHNMPNGRRYDFMCSDAFMQTSTDYSIDIRLEGSCLDRCIASDCGCLGVLYLVDRPVESTCFFLHNGDWPMMEAGERIMAAKSV